MEQINRYYTSEEIELRIDNITDKSYLPTSILESFLDGNSLAKKREGYFVGKHAGFQLGLNAFKPHRVMRSLEHSCKDENDNRFFKLLDIFFNRFGIAITFHPQEGMIFNRFKAPEKDQQGIFLTQSGSITKSEALEKLHLKIEQLSNKEISDLLMYFDYKENGTQNIV